MLIVNISGDHNITITNNSTENIQAAQVAGKDTEEQLHDFREDSDAESDVEEERKLGTKPKIIKKGINEGKARENDPGPSVVSRSEDIKQRKEETSCKSSPSISSEQALSSGAKKGMTAGMEGTQREDIRQDSSRKDNLLGTRNYEKKTKSGNLLEAKRTGLNVWKSSLLIAPFDGYY